MRSPGSEIRIAVYSALAIGLYTVENYLPMPIPWLRLGIANVAVVLALDEVGVGGAVLVFILKLILGSILSGRFLTPFFFFALIGGGMALAAMVLTRVLAKGWVSVVGISCAGGVFHNIGQLFVARYFLVPDPRLWVFLPVLTLLGVVTGTAIGLIARLVRLRRQGATASIGIT